MKISCGTDIIEIDRVKSSIESIGERFLNTIYTKKEIEYCESRKAQKYQHYAARFAAKEAIFKALSTRIGSQYTWKDFEVLNDENGKPKVFLSTEISNLEDIDISISHCKTYAVANVIAIYKEN
ncbi:MAG: holo-ACP synthase [Clostridia bacterium]|nr:holo-ACP synthase [Clostridia bacterium]